MAASNPPVQPISPPKPKLRPAGLRSATEVIPGIVGTKGEGIPGGQLFPEDAEENIPF